MLFSLGYEGTGKKPEPEVERPEVVMIRVRNVAQDRNRVLKLGKCHDRLPTTGTGSSVTDDVSNDDVSKLFLNPYIYPTGLVSQFFFITNDSRHFIITKYV